MARAGGFRRTSADGERDALLVARRDLPGRVVRDILEVIYDPRFARDLQSDLQKTGAATWPASRCIRRRTSTITGTIS